MVGNSALAEAGARGVARPRAEIIGWAATGALVLAFALGAAVRLAPVLLADFPLNDGGMFFAMIRDLQQAGYRLPQFTSYNNLVVAMYRLASAFHSTRGAVAASLLTFALVPESFVWPIMGGGLTRSMGMFFALCAMREAYLLCSRDEPKRAPWLILWCSLTLLSHLEWGWFLALTVAALGVSYARSRRVIAVSPLIAGATLVLSEPWWLSVLLAHGWAPFGAALLTGYGATAEAAAGVISVPQLLGIAGILVLIGLRRRRPFFLGWVGIILMFNLRSLFRFSSIPIALANGDFFDRQEADPMSTDTSPRAAQLLHKGLRAAFSVTVVLLLWIEVVAPLAITNGLGHLAALSPDERGAMEWVAQHTPDASRFLVVTGDGWAIDRSSEWFPVLSGRTSVATVQGTEWLRGSAFTMGDKAQEELNRCVHEDGACLTDWSTAFGVQFDYVYIPTRPAPKCCELRDALRGDSSFTAIYETPAATIFQRASATG